MTTVYAIIGDCDQGGETLMAFSTREKAEAFIAARAASPEGIAPGYQVGDWSILELQLDP